METVNQPFKYVVMSDGIQALVWALDGPIKVSKKADYRLMEGGFLVVSGDLVLPVREEILQSLIEMPRFLVSFLTESMVDRNHVLIELDLPKLYEMKGALSVMKREERRDEAALAAA